MILDDFNFEKKILILLLYFLFNSLNFDLNLFFKILLIFNII